MTLKKTLLAGALLTALPLTGCDGFLDVNDNPNVATNAPDDLLFVPGLLGYATERVIEIGPATNFFAQYYASTGSAGVFLNPERYTISSFTTGNWFSIVYTDALSNLSLLVDQAEAAEIPRPSAAGQAKILQAMIFMDMTQTFGAIPFSEALNVDEETGTTTPVYDSQVDALRGIVALVDDALGQLDASPNQRIIDGDKIYDGDLAKWRRFGNSIKLNAYVLLRAAGQSVDGEIDGLIANRDLIRSNSDNALVPFNAQSPNPLWKLNDNFGGNENVFLATASTAMDLMKRLDDPRLNVYVDSTTGGNSDTFDSVPSGSGGAFYGASDFIKIESLLDQDTPERLMTADQVLLLEAEYLADKGQTANADSRFRQGIKASLTYWGITSNDYIDAQANLSDESDDDRVDRVQQQLYIALFGRGIEGWTLARRGDPDPGDGDDGFISRPVPIQARLQGLINRFPYPSDEVNSNPNTPKITNNDILVKMAFQTPGSNS